MTKMAVFLGNPGSQYRKTRHNSGFEFCSFLNPEGHWQEKFNGLFLKNTAGIFLMPQTFMNESGISVQKASAFFGTEPCDIVVVHDDIELPFGTVKLQAGGGMGGHNGLRSVKQHLGTDSFMRLRIGVGRPSYGDVASWVLSGFNATEQAELTVVFGKAKVLLEDFFGNKI